MELNVLDLFSGIGGFSVGLEATGKFKTIGFCEQDKFCQKVLRKHWSDVPIYEDIKKLDARKIKADVVVGGFPCQSISIAGKQKGKDDDRFLFPEMLRVIKEVQPRWIIAENVQNLINISDGQILQELHNSLEACGFEVQTFNISASSQGAWHKRSRVWIVAANTSSQLLHGCSSTTRNSPKKFKRMECNQSKIRGEVWSKTKRCSEQDLQLPNTKSIRSQGHELQHNLENGQELTEQLCQTGVKKQSTWWETESKLFGVPNGIQTESHPDRANRIKALGNSVCPPIITEIGKAIIKAEEEN